MKQIILYIILSLSTSFIFLNNSIAITPEATLNSIKQTVPDIPHEDINLDESMIKWNTKNNLIRQTGMPFIAKGDKMILEGYIRDLNGVPIDGVRVKILHANSNGDYQFHLPKDKWIDKNFLSTGISVTNNKGYYRFQTIFPGSFKGQAPHIHMLIKYHKQTINTKIYFINHPKNKTDLIYQNLPDNVKDIITTKIYFLSSNKKTRTARYDIILNWIQSTKTF